MASLGYRRSAYFFFQLRKSPLTLVGLAIILLMCLAALLAPYIAAHEPDMINLRARLQPPSWSHFFGTDEVGRDICSRVLHGGRQSIGVGLFVAFVASVTGSIVGCFAGLTGRYVDTVIMRVMDVVLSVPFLVFTMAFVVAVETRLIYVLLTHPFLRPY